MKILAIETSCDETAIAALEVTGGLNAPRFNILSNIVSSQVSLHAEWGGVVPNIAKREHIKNLPIVYEQALKKSGIKESEIDAIAVTVGPGLEPALWTGINFAQNLTKVLGKPVVAVNHMEGHIYSVFLNEKQFLIPNFQFPTVALLVSGGHTEIVLIKDWMDYEIIGQTRDDAVGEAFDKVAKMLELPYPGGPAIAALAAQISNSEFLISKKNPNTKNSKSKSKIKKISSSNYKLQTTNYPLSLPRPMLHSDDFDFSFSGLKTAVLYLIRKLEKEFNCPPSSFPFPLIPSICAEFQQAAIDTLIFKTIKAAEKYNAKTIILGGGVSANEKLKKELEEALKKDIPSYKFYAPSSKFSGDNAAMIAVAAYFHAIKKEFVKKPEEIMAEGNLSL